MYKLLTNMLVFVYVCPCLIIYGIVLHKAHVRLLGFLFKACGVGNDIKNIMRHRGYDHSKNHKNNFKFFLVTLLNPTSQKLLFHKHFPRRVEPIVIFCYRPHVCGRGCLKLVQTDMETCLIFSIKLLNVSLTHFSHH